MSAWSKPPSVVSVESKLRSFCAYALGKIDAAAPSLSDGKDDYAELCQFCAGMSRSLKATAAGASKQLQRDVADALAAAWDLREEKPGRTSRPAGGNKGPSLDGMDVAAAVRHLWERVDAGRRVERGDGGFELALQHRGVRDDGADPCDSPLFASCDEGHAFWKSPVTRAFVALLDNYERETGKAEVFTRTEKREMDEFLDLLVATPHMRFVLEYLQRHGRDARAKKLRSALDLKHLLFDLWFAPYRRFKPNDSSGFEHVFVGEESRGAITGLHNWVQFYLEEKKGNVNYLGWTGRQDRHADDDVHVVTVKFSWADDDPELEVKPMSTMLCGSTVEFEFAALTLAFLAGDQNGDTKLALGDEQLRIVCHAMRSKFGAHVGSAYFELA
ncbi:Poly(U)-specific endoribonuclease [Aureococcus anophagefferens]|uniref:Poly(U)-specific endoribonuclease n=1 Tax=Aureococcus anophagefferens TaxID=44056 RepID=A0ABR1GEK9_AURAN